jgi:uncharacterized protein with NAD-binding domain and iron-sulfur cluster
MTEPENVVILGGGLGSLVTALELTRPGVNAGKYRVTIYQMGHRLGGKGASGRNAGVHQRNEEHGLHVWLGFYENAFRLMREVLAEWDIPPTHPWSAPNPGNRWRNAFHPHSYAPLTEERGKLWEIWHMHFPARHNGTPGDGIVPAEDLWSLLMKLQESLLDIFEDEAPEFTNSESTNAPPSEPAPPRAAAPEKEAPKMNRRVKAARVQFPHVKDTGNMGQRAKSGCLSLLGFGRWRLARLAEEMCGLTVEELLSRPEESLRRLGIVLNLSWALVRGITRYYWRIKLGTFDVLDHMELRDFLRENGASEEALTAPIASAIYDSIFAWEGGDPGKERLAAGAGIRCLLRIFFSYKEALSWKMQAGMGDTIFTPMYQVLRKRGVQFKFFHEVKQLHLSADRRRIDRIVIGRQVTLAGGVAEYHPLVNVNGLDCWPSEPLWGQIEAGEAAAIRTGGHNLEHANNGWADRETITLRHGVPDGFDRVVLGISLGAIPSIARELMAARRPFARMVEKVKTVRTQAWQAWMKRDTVGLGWNFDPPVLSNFRDPLNTWADMTFLLPREQNPPEVRSVHYFCGPLLDAVPPDQVDAHVRQNVQRLQHELARSLWPGADGAGTFDQQLIHHEYQRANINGSDRYVLSLPGTTKFRLRANRSGFANLTLAGDWTRNQFNVGCVEATVMSGRFAAQAISGHPRNGEIAYSKGP